MPPEQQTQVQNQPQTFNIPQQPVSQVGYAGFWMRYLALNLDSLITSIIISLPLNIVATVVGASTGFKTALFVLQVVLIYTYFIYLTNKNQATIGKRLLGLRVVSEDGTKLSLGKIAFRETIGKFISFIILCIGYLMVAFTAKKQGLHDKMVGSIVLYNRAERKTWAFVVSIMFAVVAPILIAVAIVGIMSAVTLASLNVAREKGADATVKASLAEVRAQAEISYDMNNNSYSAIFTDPGIKSSLQRAATTAKANPVGHANATSYAIYMPLKNPTPPATGWCIDSTGVARESVDPGTATVCP